MRVLLLGHAVILLMSCTEGGICTHPEFNSVYREDCFSFGAEEVLLSDQLVDAISAQAQLSPSKRQAPHPEQFPRRNHCARGASGLDFALCSIPMCQDLGRLTQR